MMGVLRSASVGTYNEAVCLEKAPKRQSYSTPLRVIKTKHPLTQAQCSFLCTRVVCDFKGDKAAISKKCAAIRQLYFDEQNRKNT